MRHIQENIFISEKDITIFTLIEVYRVRKMVPQDRPKVYQNQVESSLFEDLFYDKLVQTEC